MIGHWVLTTALARAGRTASQNQLAKLPRVEGCRQTGTAAMCRGKAGSLLRRLRKVAIAGVQVIDEQTDG